MKRFVSILLLLALLLGCLPVSVLADGEGYFYLAASTQSSLIIAPERVYYTSGQTVGEALAASGHVFTGMESGIVSAIDGASGNFVRGDENGAFDLNEQASSVNYYYFREGDAGALSSALQSLMKTMADYLYEEADVRAYAKSVYDDAKAKFSGITDADAQTCAAAITDAINAYKDGQNTKYKVTFSGYSGSDYTIYAVSKYGKRIDGANGSIELPSGAYTFYIYKDNKAVSGSLTVEGGAKTITGLPTIPTTDWMNENAFQISETSDLESDAAFEGKQLKLTHSTHTASAEVYDTFYGWLYPYVTLKSGVSASEVKLKAIYTSSADGTVKTVELASGSKRTPLYDVLSKSAKGNTVIFRASRTSGDYTLLEDFTLTLNRTLTLSGLTVTNALGDEQLPTSAFSPTNTAYTYEVLNTEESLNIYPVAAVSGVSVTVNKAELNTDGYASVGISGETQISIVLTAENYTSTYVLTIKPGAGSRVKLTLENADSVVVKNSSGRTLTPDSSSTEKTKYYTLVVGQQYSYYATRDTFYHTEETFTLTQAGVLSGYKVTVPEDKMPSLSALQVSTAKEHSTTKLALDKTFASTEHEYTTTVADSDSNIYAWAAPAAGSSAECTVSYNIISKQAADGTAAVVKLTGNLLADGTQLEKVLLTQNAYGNTLTFNVAQSTTNATGTTTYSTDYVLTVKRDLTLQNLEISGATLDKAFSGAAKAYTITVPSAQTKLSLTATAWSNARYDGTDGGYALYVNGDSATSGEAKEVALTGKSADETVQVRVESRDGKSDPVTYTITVKKAAGSGFVFSYGPADATLFIFNQTENVRVDPKADGSYELSTNYTYSCSLTMKGYIGYTDTFELTNKTTLVLSSDGKSYTNDQAISLPTLTAAPESTLKQFEAEWPDFRGNANNNGVTEAPTPVDAEDGTLYWAKQVGVGYGSKAVGSPILVGGYLYTYAGTSILKVDKDTGEVLKSGEMEGISSFGIVPPTYADGMILVGLSNGRIQAFNAETLESLWLYTDPLSGQPNCPITVHDGYAYTGFWNNETEDAAFVCLSLTDEYPNSKTESKPATWRYVQKGGFYWAGAYVCDDFVLVGTDDGTSNMDSATANLLLLEPKTGKELDIKTNIKGDIRSSICYDDTTKAYYFTTKGGYFYKVTVEKQKLGEPAFIKLGGMSTSTPVVCNGRAYVGVSGTNGHFGDGGHNLSVIDLGTWRVAYKVPTNGYPQTSGLLTTAHGYWNYIYFFENLTPGTLRVIRDMKGISSADGNYQTKETAGLTAYALFTPVGGQAQYAICSPIVDKNGTLYFKNDSGYLMAFGNAIDELVVTKQPDKTHYSVGETFDSTGMTVTAKYHKNELERDVTAEISYTKNPLKEDDEVISLIYGSGRIMYHNKRNDDGTMTSGEETNYKVEVPITVGAVTGKISTINWTYSSGKLTLSGTFPSGKTLVAAVYDKDGRLTGTKLFTSLTSEELSGTKIRLFLLGSDGKPVCTAVNVVGN